MRIVKPTLSVFGLYTQGLSSIPKEVRLARQLELTNRILVLLAETTPDAFDEAQSRLLRAELLIQLSHQPLQRADTPLSSSCLMTGTRQDPTLVSQLRKEIASADRVDILCSFIKWGGVRILEDSQTPSIAAAANHQLRT